MPLNQYKWFSDWKSLTGAASMPVFSSRKSKGDIGLLISCACETRMIGTSASDTRSKGQAWHSPARSSTCPSRLAHSRFLDESS